MAASDASLSQSTTPSTRDSLGSVKTRRSKGKSRLGCRRCKSSRVKCDEIHPTCGRCTRASEPCVYPATRRSEWRNSTTTLVFSPTDTEEPPLGNGKKTQSLSKRIPIAKSRYSPLNVSGKGRESSLASSQLSCVPLEDSHSFSTQDVFLLMHFTSSTSGDIWGSRQIWVEDGLQLAFRHSFLMHAILALTARHVQMLPEALPSYPLANIQHLEACHYHKALSIYSSGFLQGVSHNQHAVIAASLIFVYYSCSLLDFNPAADNPSDDTSITFIRGIRMIVQEMRITNHVDKPIFTLLFPNMSFMQLHFLPQNPQHGPGKRLLNLIAARPSTEKHRELYINCVESLTSYFETCALQPQAVDPPYAEDLVLYFLRWQAMCPPQFVQLIQEYDGVALAILAHYYAAAACHLMRLDKVWWWWKDKPAYMVRTILDYLSDGEWEEWKEWPRLMLARTEREEGSVDTI